jgi:hypothetical protein
MDGKWAWVRLAFAATLGVATTLAVAAGGAASTPRAASARYCAKQNAVFRRHRPYLGISDNQVQLESPQLMTCTLGLMAADGFGYYRIEINWAGTEYYPGYYNWVGTDALVTSFARHHIHILGGLLGAPRWNSTDPADDALDNYPPANPAQFANFAALNVQRYGPHGQFWRDHPTLPYDPITAWQVWNEPNLPEYWPPGVNPAAYAALLRASDVAIKHADASATVVSAGMPFFGAADETAFISGMFKAGLGDKFDALAIHEYAPTLAVAKQHLLLARKLLNRFHERKKALWITELGFAGGNPDAYIPNVRKAAKETRKFFAWLRKTRGLLKLKEIFWYGWFDGGPPGGDTHAWGYHLGLFTSNMQPKPVLPVVTRAARLFDR